MSMRDLEFNRNAFESDKALWKFVAWLDTLDEPEEEPTFQVDVYDKETDRPLSLELKREQAIRLANFIYMAMGGDLKCPRCDYQKENQLTIEMCYPEGQELT